jgi:hypothetical protein
MTRRAMAFSRPSATREHVCSSAGGLHPFLGAGISLHRCKPGLSIQPCPASPPFPQSPTSRPDEPSRSGPEPVPSPVRWSNSICGMRLQDLANTTKPLKRSRRVLPRPSGVGAHARPKGQGEGHGALELSETISSFWGPRACLEGCRCLCRLEGTAPPRAGDVFRRTGVDPGTVFR